jgi:hypothetical protein
MNPFRLGLIVLTVLMTIASLSIAFVMKRPGGAGVAPIPEPISYAKPTADGKHLFVAFGLIASEEKLKDAGMRQLAAAVRAKFAKPGLYRIDDASTPVYTLEGYSPDDQVYLSIDGQHVIRIEGDWWKTKAYPAGRRLAEDVENQQLDSVAVRCFTAGQLTHEYRLRELIDDPADLPHSPEHILWPAGAVLNQDERRFHLFTQDANRITIDVSTGLIVARSKSGLGNPISQWMIFITIGLTILMAAVLLWYTFFKRRAEAAAEAKTA